MNWRKLIYLALFLGCAVALYFHQKAQEKQTASNQNQTTTQGSHQKDVESGRKDGGNKSLETNKKKPSTSTNPKPKTSKPTTSKSEQTKGSTSSTKQKPAAQTKPGPKKKFQSSSKNSGSKVSQNKPKTAPKPTSTTKKNPASRFGVKEFPWKSVSRRGAFTSPEGLVYGPGKEHRLEHVLRHAVDQPNRQGRHGVFLGGPDKTLQTIDRAYAKVKKKSKDARVSKQGTRTIYEVRMQSKIGYVGGQTGNRKGKPAAYKVKIVVAGDNVITAYPF